MKTDVVRREYHRAILEWRERGTGGEFLASSTGLQVSHILFFFLLIFLLLLFIIYYLLFIIIYLFLFAINSIPFLPVLI